MVAALRRRGDGDAVRRVIQQRVSETPKCPRCGAAHIRRCGMEHGLQQCCCVGCGRTFNALTGTPLARLRKKECWASFANSFQQSHSVREAARQAGVAKNTSFRRRHRFLRVDKDTLNQKLTGIVEVDESFFILECRKGERRLPREARKRGGKAEKPGLSDEQTPLLIARDPHGDQIDAVLPNRTAEAVEAALDGVLAKDDVLLCVDSDPMRKSTASSSKPSSSARASMCTRRSCTCKAGGGDTVAALNAAGLTDKFAYVSTAGARSWNGWRASSLEGRKPMFEFVEP